MKTYRTLRSKDKSALPAFSLAEVVISLSIAALGFVSLLGLLPQGMAMSRQAANLAAESRITQQITAELNATPWNKISWVTGYNERRYFDDQGIEIPVNLLNRPENQFALTYVAAIYVPSGTGKDSKSMSLPVAGSPANRITQEQYLRRVRLYIANTTNKNFNFPDAAPSTVSYSTIVLVKSGTETAPP